MKHKIRFILFIVFILFIGFLVTAQQIDYTYPNDYYVDRVLSLNQSGENFTADLYCDGTGCYSTAQFLFDSNASTGCNDDYYLDGNGKCIHFNNTVIDINKITYYNVTTIEAIVGTLIGINESLGIFDGISINISEESAEPGLDVRVNFTEITEFNQLIVRYKTTPDKDHETNIELYDFVNSVWEDHDFYIESEHWDNPYIPIWDSTVHVGTGDYEGQVWVRFYTEGRGKITHIHQYDFIQLSLGTGTFASQEVDPLSYHKNKNIDAENFNATFDNLNTTELTITAPFENPYKLTQRFASGTDDILAIQSQTSGEPFYLDFFTADGDGTDFIAYTIWAKGTPNQLVAYEGFTNVYSPTDRQFQLYTVSGGTGSDLPLNLFSGSSNKNQLCLYNDSSGNIGMGTCTPDAPLDIEEQGTAKSNLDILHLTNTIASTDMVGTETSILFNQHYCNSPPPTCDPTAVADSGRIRTGTETDWTDVASTQDSYMALETSLDGTMTEYVRITSDGNVGIGTTNPSSLLQTAQVENTTEVNLSNVLFVNSTSGNVGIGTTGSGYKLDIDAGTIGDNNYNGLRIIDQGWTAVSHPMLEFYNSNAQFNGSLARIYGEIGNVGTNSKLYFAVADSSKSLQDRMVIDKSGNVGIGTASPSQKLDIVAGGSGVLISDTGEGRGVAKSLFFGDGGGTWTPIIWGVGGATGVNKDAGLHLLAETEVADDSGTEPLIRLNARQIDSTEITTRPLLAIENDGSQLVTVDKDGKVGIGTTNPSDELNVVGNVNFTGNLSFPDNNGLCLGDGGRGDPALPCDAIVSSNGSQLHIQIDSEDSFVLGGENPTLRIGTYNLDVGLDLFVPFITAPLGYFAMPALYLPGGSLFVTKSTGTNPDVQLFVFDYDDDTDSGKIYTSGISGNTPDITIAPLGLDTNIIGRLNVTEYLVVGAQNATGVGAGDIVGVRIHYDELVPKSPHMFGEDPDVDYTRFCVKDKQGYWDLIYWDNGLMKTETDNKICNDKDIKLNQRQESYERWIIDRENCVNETHSIPNFESYNTGNTDCYYDEKKVRDLGSMMGVTESESISNLYYCSTKPSRNETCVCLSESKITCYYEECNKSPYGRCTLGKWVKM